MRDTQRYLGSLWIGGGRCPWLGCALLQGNLCARTVGRYGACTSIRASSSHFCFPVARGLGRGTIGRYTWVGPRDTHRCRVSVVPHPRAAQVWDLKRVGRRETPSGKLCLLPSPFRAFPSVGMAYGWAWFWRLSGRYSDAWRSVQSFGPWGESRRTLESPEEHRLFECFTWDHCTPQGSGSDGRLHVYRSLGACVQELGLGRCIESEIG